MLPLAWEVTEVKVLVATDQSQNGNLAVDLARSTTWPPDTLLRVLTCIEPLGAGGELGVPPYTYDDALVTSAREGLQSAASGVKRPGLLTEYVVCVGRAADEIVRQAADLKADLVIVGSRGRGPLATTLLGSVAAEVVDRSPCPVLVARRPALNKIVLAEDGSSGAAGALAYLTSSPFATSLAEVPVQVTGVVDTDMPWALTSGIDGHATGPMYEAYQEGLGAQRKALATKTRETAEVLTRLGRRATAALREGHPASELIAEASESDGDLIVVGTRGRTGLERLALGSVTRAVLTHAKCSVLVVHQKTERSAGARPAAKD